MLTRNIVSRSLRAPIATRAISSSIARRNPEQKGADIKPPEQSLGKEPKDDLNLDPAKSSDPSGVGKPSFASTTKEPDANTKPKTSGTPGTNKLD